MRHFFYVSPSGSDWYLSYLRKVLARNHNKAVIVASGRKVARENVPSELVIQNADGTISARETYGQDPFPPRG